MEQFIMWAPGICGVFWVIFSLISKTKNLYSSILYKVFPFITGMVCVFSSLKLLGFI